MNLFKNTLVSKLMLVALMLVGGKTMLAESKLYIEPVVIDDYKVHSIPVIFEHDGNMGALNFDIELSKSLEFDVKINNDKTIDVTPAVTRNPDFLANGQQMTINVETQNGYENSQTARVMVVTRRGNPFPANKGIVAYINVKAKKDALDKTIEKDPELFISVKRVTATTPDNKVSEKVADKTYDVSQISEIKLDVTGGDFIMNPKGQKNVMLNLVNNVNVATFMFDMELPEGFKVAYDNCGFTSRASNGAWLDYFPSKTNPNSIRFIVTDIETNAAFSGKSGDIMWIALEAPESFESEVVIKFSNIEVGTKDSKTFYGPDFSTKISNGGSVYEKALAEVKVVENSFKEAIEAIAKDCPDVKDIFKGEEISGKIADLKKAIDTAYAQTTLGSDYANVMAPKAEIEAAIAKLVEDAKAAQAKVDADKALKAAAEKATAEIKALNDKLAAALESIAKNCPLVADDFKGENVAAAIKALQDKVDAAVADGSLTEKYDEVMANTIGELIDTLVKEAEIAQSAAVEAEAAEKARKENNEKAYKEDLAAIDELTAKLQAEIKALEDHFNAIGETEPNWVLVEQTNILVKIRDLKTKADNENDRVAKEGDYRKQVDALDTMLVNQLIAAYVANVKTSGIDSIISDENLGNVRIYTIDGVQHNTLVPGVNIIVKEDGTTTKVYVK